MPHRPLPALTRTAVGAVAWSTLEISSRYGAQFIVMLFLARLLRPDDFGLLAMLLVFTSAGALLVDAGFGVALIQNQQTSDDDETTVFVFSTCAAVLVAALLWWTAPAIARFYDQPDIVRLARAVLVVIPLGALGAVPDAILTRRLDFRSRTRSEVIATTISAILAIALALRGFGVWSLVCQAIAWTATRAALLWLHAGWRPRGRFSSQSFRRLVSFGGFMFLASALDTFSLRLQSLLIGRFFDAATLGYYTVAQNTQQAPTSFIGGILNRVGLPVFSQVAHRPEKLVGALRMSLRITLFVFIPCMIGIALTASPLIDLLYGTRWEAAAPILTMLALSAALWPLHVLNLAALSAQGRSDLYFRLEVVKKLIGIALIAAASPFGTLAMAGAVLIASLFGVVINTWYSKKLLHYGMLAQLTDQRGTFALSAAAALVGWAILHWNRPGAVPTLAAIGCAVAVYVIGAVWTRDPALSDVISLVRGSRITEPHRPPMP